MRVVVGFSHAVGRVHWPVQACPVRRWLLPCVDDELLVVILPTLRSAGSATRKTSLFDFKMSCTASAARMRAVSFPASYPHWRSCTAKDVRPLKRRPAVQVDQASTVPTGSTLLWARPSDCTAQHISPKASSCASLLTVPGASS